MDTFFLKKLVNYI